MLTCILNYLARQPKHSDIFVDYRSNYPLNTYNLIALDYSRNGQTVMLWANVPVDDLSTLKGIALISSEFIRIDSHNVNARTLYRIACNILRAIRYAETHLNGSVSFHALRDFENALAVLAETYPAIVRAAKESI